MKSQEIDVNFLKQFSTINAKRSRQLYNSLSKWKKEDWVVALSEEVGEIAGFVKKEKRDRKNHKKEIGKEIADVFMYLDLFCTSQGYDFGQLIIDKFNEVSKRKKNKIRLKIKER